MLTQQGLIKTVLSPPGFCIEAKRVIAAMQTQPSIVRQRLINDCIVALKAAGVWTLLDGVSVFAAHTKQAALLNWANPGTYDFSEVNSPTFTVNQGYTGNGTNAYLSTSYNLSSSGGQFARDTASHFGYANTSAQDAKAFWGLSSGTGSPGNRLYSRWTDDSHYFTLNATGEDSYSNVEGKGFYSVSRRTSTSTEAYKNGVSKVTSVRPSIALPNDTWTVLGEGVNYHSGQVLCVGWGNQMTTAQHLALYNALHTYMQKVAGVA